jgi:CheY-like chemotaxis protein
MDTSELLERYAEGERDFDRVNLSHAKLNSINLSEAKLNEAFLDKAFLNKAILDKVNLCGAHLNNAQLRGAKLRGANLSTADLSAADLTAADLNTANLQEADLRGANLSYSKLCDANLSGANLSGAQVKKTLFASNLGISQENKLDLIRRGAIFEGRGKTILIIEDEGFIRDNLIELLEIEGYEAMGAENGSVGVQLAKEYQPGLILCDVMMPELDGYGVLEALRQDSATATIPFIFLTASADRSNLQRIRELGRNDYILKPFNVDQFLQAIATHLED